jgi:hypothetical protein
MARFLALSVLVLGGALAGCTSSASHHQPRSEADTCRGEAPGCQDAHRAHPAAAASNGHGHGHGHGMPARCPLQVPGSTARVEDVEGGVAIVFTTTGDVAEVRNRTQSMARMHNDHHATGSGHGMMGHGTMMGGAGAGHEMMGHGTMMGAAGAGHGMMGHGTMMGAAGAGHGMMGREGGMLGHGMMKMPPSDATAEDVEGGARLTFRPKAASDLPSLRERVREHATAMASGRCPMMHAAGGH